MIRAQLLAAAAATALGFMAAPAMADDRLVEHRYAQDEVVRIDGRTGVQATIAFGEGEAIENVAVGDSQSWQITPNKRANLLFVKPLEASGRTNMTVVTNLHTYFFDLVASPKARPLYMLRFTYDEPAPTPPTETERLAGLNDMERALATGDPLAVPSDPSALNFSWKRTGDDKLMPARIYDDGVSTYLVWPERGEVPAILIENEKGEEGPVNYAVRGSAIVIPDIPDLIILRSGKASARLENTLSEEDRARAALAASAPSPAPRTAAAAPQDN